MAGTDNLKSWKPGESGNPSGYSRKRRFSDALERLIEEEGPEDFLRIGWLAAKSGDFNFWKYLYERHEGKIEEPELPQDDGVMAELEQRAAERQSKKPASGHPGPVQE